MLTHALYGSPVLRRAHGFEQNSLNGILLHSLARWNAVILENMTNYVRGVQTFRRTCTPNLEMSKWMQEGMAEGISPWMHFIGARQEDRRQFENGRPLLDWHSKNEDTLYHRPPLRTWAWCGASATSVSTTRTRATPSAPSPGGASPTR